MYLSAVHACANHNHRASTSLIVRDSYGSYHNPSYHWRNRPASECETNAGADRPTPNREWRCGMILSACFFSLEAGSSIDPCAFYSLRFGCTLQPAALRSWDWRPNEHEHMTPARLSADSLLA